MNDTEAAAFRSGFIVSANLTFVDHARQGFVSSSANLAINEAIKATGTVLDMLPKNKKAKGIQAL
jgi:hypothetical protein